MTEHDTTITDFKEISNAFNNFFVNIGPIVNSKFGFRQTVNPRTALDNASSNLKSFFFEVITPAEIFTTINQLNSTKANGPENISVKFHKLASAFISSLPCDIFNFSPQMGSFHMN